MRKVDRKPAKRVTVAVAWTTKPVAPRGTEEEMLSIGDHHPMLFCCLALLVCGSLFTRGAECGGKEAFVVRMDYLWTQDAHGSRRGALRLPSLELALKDTYLVST